MKSLSLFYSRSATLGFAALFFGFLVIMISGIYIFTVFLDVSHFYITPDRLSVEVIRSVRLARALPDTALKNQVKQLQFQGLQITTTANPEKEFKVLSQVRPKDIRTQVHQNPNAFKLSIALPNGQWLNVQRRMIQHPWISVGFFFSAIVLLLALFLLCYLVVKRLAIPLSTFATAATRFGMDVHAPPLAVAGSEEIQAVVKAFNDMQSRIRRLLHDRTQMLAAVSHDLRTPITRLQLRAEYLKGTPQYEKAIADLQDMDNMIGSILSFARDHAQTETMERFNFNALLEVLCDDMVDMGRAVAFTDQAEKIAYFGRMSSLRRAMTNFIDNAIKYGQTAEVVLSQTPQAIQIKISDQGPGIPADQVEKVFDPFYRVDPARSPQISGTGLGMTVARDIIRAHGGDVTLMNHAPHGLTVIISLPYSSERIE